MKKIIYSFLFLLSMGRLYGAEPLPYYEDFLNSIDYVYQDLKLGEEAVLLLESLEGRTFRFGALSQDYYIVAIYRLLGKVMGINTEVVYYDEYNTLLKDVAAGEIDFTGRVLFTDEWDQDLEFSGPINQEVLLLVLNPQFFRYSHSIMSNSIRDSNLRIGVLEGTSYKFLLDGLIVDDVQERIREFPDDSSAIEAIYNDELDAFMTNRSWYFSEYADRDLQVLQATSLVEPPLNSIVSGKNRYPGVVGIMAEILYQTGLADELDRFTSQLIGAQIGARMREFITAQWRETAEAGGDWGDKGHLNIAIHPLGPYLNYEKGEAKGLIFEVFSGIVEALGVTYTIYETSGRMETLELLEKGEVDLVFPFSHTPALEEVAYYSAPIMTVNNILVARDSPTNHPIRRMGDLYPHKVGVLDNGFHELYLEKLIPQMKGLQAYPDYRAALLALERRTVEYVYAPDYLIQDYMENVSQGARFIPVNTVVPPSNQLYFLFARTPKGSLYARVFSTILTEYGFDFITDQLPQEGLGVSLYYRQRAERYQVLSDRTLFFGFITVLILSLSTYFTRRNAIRDPMTKLYNRRTLDEAISSLTSQQSIAYIDLDNFKAINEIYGHHTGEKVICHVARGLEDLGPLAKGRAFRVGGDEFVVIFNTASTAMDSIQKVIGSYLRDGENKVRIEGSIGFLEYGKYEVELDNVLNLIDYVMLDGKRRGKNITIEVNQEHIDRFNLLSDMKEKGSFEDLELGSYQIWGTSFIKAEEVYLLHLEAGYKGAGISIAEKELSGILESANQLLGYNKYMLRRLCGLMKELEEKKEPQPHYFSISLSGVALRKLSSPEELGGIVRSYGLNPEKICFRLPEGLGGGEHLSQKLRGLSALGFRFIIAGYQNDYRSSQLMEELRVEALKLAPGYSLFFYRMIKGQDNMQATGSLQSYPEFRCFLQYLRLQDIVLLPPEGEDEEEKAFYSLLQTFLEDRFFCENRGRSLIK